MNRTHRRLHPSSSSPAIPLAFSRAECFQARGDSSRCLCGRLGREICPEPGHSILGKCAHLIGQSARHSTDVLIRAKRGGATRPLTYEPLVLTNTRCLAQHRRRGKDTILPADDKRNSAKRTPP